MFAETLDALEAKIRQSSAISADNRTELLQLLSTLRAELATLVTMPAAHGADRTDTARTCQGARTRHRRRSRMA